MVTQRIQILGQGQRDWTWRRNIKNCRSPRKLWLKYKKIKLKYANSNELDLTAQQLQMAKFMSKFNEKEMAYTMKQFKGRCCHCGKVGHKAEDC